MTSVIYFIKFARFSNTNRFVEDQLKRVFPEAEIRVFDVRSVFTRPSLPLMLGLLRSAPRVFADLARGRLRLKDLSIAVIQLLQRDAGMFRMTGNRARAEIEKHRANVWFTIQTQGLWDNTVEGIPNFIYTDSAALTNLQYKETDRRLIPSQDWLRQEHDLYAKAAGIFVMSEHVRTSIIEQYAQVPERVKRVRVGSNIGLDLDGLNAAPETNKTILFVGVEWERKGGPQLVEAFRQLPDRHRDARLVIVGVSPEIVIAGVEIVGRVSPSEVSRQYRQAAIFCLPTKIEPFGIVFIEAMQHKVAVVAPAQGAMPDFIRDRETGMLVAPGDTDDLVAALTWLLDHPAERRRIAERGSIEVRDSYTWDAVGDSLRSEILAVVRPVGPP